jgi:hypothetical protein
MDAMAGIKERYSALRQVLDERSRRLVVAEHASGRYSLGRILRFGSIAADKSQEKHFC